MKRQHVCACVCEERASLFRAPHTTHPPPQKTQNTTTLTGAVFSQAKGAAAKGQDDGTGEAGMGRDDWARASARARL